MTHGEGEGLPIEVVGFVGPSRVGPSGIRSNLLWVQEEMLVFGSGCSS